ncbi:hypothetical protein AXG89_15215 [Burkholderia sp. PAMC 26561]|nr:hypothetical protein AXG89_15215 [Burkholderia sp. PAMC 26561]
MRGLNVRRPATIARVGCGARARGAFAGGCRGVGARTAGGWIAFDQPQALARKRLLRPGQVQYFEETKLPHVRVGDKAESRELLADVNPTFNWVRLAQRVPVRIRNDKVPDSLILAAGTTCTVTVTPSS